MATDFSILCTKLISVTPVASGAAGRANVGLCPASRLSASAIRGPIYKISYDLSYHYRKFIVRSTYDSD